MPAAYQRTQTDTIIRLADRASIPADPRNADYRDYLAWLSAGNPPEAADPPPSTVPETVTKFQLKAAMRGAGILNDVEKAMADKDTDPLVQLAWAETGEFPRKSMSVLAVSKKVKWSEAQIDQLFVSAARIQV